MLKKHAVSPEIAFKKDNEGGIARVVIERDNDRIRRLTLMKQDGLSLQFIAEIEGELTREELQILGF
jgi:hypothetical protein